MGTKPVKSMLYVCTANVYRSLVAQEMTEQMLHRLDVRDVGVESAGMIKYRGEPIRGEVVDLTRKYGIDVLYHRPMRVNGGLVSRADVILVFERPMITKLEERFQNARGKTYFIADYAGHANDPDMEDLRGKPLENFEQFIQLTGVYVQGCVMRIMKE